MFRALANVFIFICGILVGVFILAGYRAQPKNLAELLAAEYPQSLITIPVLKPKMLDVQTAINEGHSYYDIVANIATGSTVLKPFNVPTPPKNHFDVGKAVADGVSYYDIVSYISARDATQSTTPMILVNVPATPPSPEIQYRTQYVPQYIQQSSPQIDIHCSDNGFTGLLHQMNCSSY